MKTTLNDTDSTAIAAALVSAHAAEGPATGMVHTLIVACQEVSFERAYHAALDAAREHPSRVILVVENPDTSGLDADIRVGEGVPGDVITLRMSPGLAEHLETILLPLLLPDSPVIAWWPGESPEEPAEDPLGRLATRRITDAGGVEDPIAALVTRAVHHAPGDTDLTWTRLTPWRALLAAALDQYPTTVLSAEVEAAAHNAPAELIAAWLDDRLGVPVTRTESQGPGLTGVRMHTDEGDIALLRPSGSMATYEVPGQPQRIVALKRREMNALITEELRHSEADEVFEAACRTFLQRVQDDLAKPSMPREGGGAAAEPWRAHQPWSADETPLDDLRTTDQGARE